MAKRIGIVRSVMITGIFAGVFAALCACRGHGEPTSLLLSDEELNSPPTLLVGDAAPPLVASSWLVGEPAPALTRGSVYVLDFWAGWCGPCIAIMPRLSTLQESLKDDGVVIIAVTALDNANTRSEVNDAIESLRPVKFRVAIDGGPKGDATLAAYSRASRQTSIPRTFVVDRNGKLAWIGHPQDAEPVIRSVAAGTWDLAAAKAQFDRDARERHEARALVNQWLALPDGVDRVKELEILDKLASFEPQNIPFSPPFMIDDRRVRVLKELGRTDDAVRAFESAVLKEEFADDAWAMAQLATALGGLRAEASRALATKAGETVAAHEASLGKGDSWDRFIAGARRSWDAQAMHMLAGFWRDQGDYPRALEAADKALAMTDTRFRQQVDQRRALRDSIAKRLATEKAG